MPVCLNKSCMSNMERQGKTYLCQTSCKEQRMYENKTDVYRKVCISSMSMDGMCRISLHEK